MHLKILEAQYDGKVFRIEEDLPEVGYYFYVYEDGKCIFDYLQENCDQCKEQARKLFEVPLNCWRQINKG